MASLRESRRFTTPPRASPEGAGPSCNSFSGEPRPVAPDNNLRSRSSRAADETMPGGDVSPTSTITSNLSRSAFRNALPVSASSALSTPARKVVIRADPSLVTCFDPSDKELYDLWAPRR